MDLVGHLDAIPATGMHESNTMLLHVKEKSHSTFVKFEQIEIESGLTQNHWQCGTPELNKCIFILIR